MVHCKLPKLSMHPNQSTLDKVFFIAFVIAETTFQAISIIVIHDSAKHLLSTFILSQVC